MASTLVKNIWERGDGGGGEEQAWVFQVRRKAGRPDAQRHVRRSQHFTHRRLRSAPGLRHSKGGSLYFHSSKENEGAWTGWVCLSWRRAARLLFIWAPHPLHPPGTVCPPFLTRNPSADSTDLESFAVVTPGPGALHTKGSSCKFTEWTDKFGRFGKVFQNMLM